MSITADAREQVIRRWFRMWLDKEDTGITALFAADAIYTESWGPEYRSAEAVRHWFEEWNTRGTVLVWDIRQFLHQGDQTVVEWRFQCRMNDGSIDAFDGLSLVVWAEDGRIQRLTEYGCNSDRYDPYQNGPEPVFRDNAHPWF